MDAKRRSIVNEFPWGTIEWLANDEVGNSRELSLARMTLPPGNGTDTHVHANCEESIYVVRGEVECRIGEHRVRMSAGGQSVVPRGAVHGIRNVGDAQAEIILSYSSAARAFELA
jgi:mannose-6-phosphate isomerase-like protein (cupin superfamily)